MERGGLVPRRGGLWGGAGQQDERTWGDVWRYERDIWGDLGRYTGDIGGEDERTVVLGDVIERAPG